MDDYKIAAKLASILLQYPDEDLLALLPAVELAALGLSHGNAVNHCDKFLEYLRSADLLVLQEVYTRSFDLNPKMALHLSFHKFGDGKERGFALADLAGRYQQAGYECANGELPDFLPLILEFVSFGDVQETSGLISEYREVIKELHRGLLQEDNPYADLFALIVELSDGLTQEKTQ
jgi:nitrate reductase molybdenum cofactor assembly chaperone NarJ/NarW